LSHVNAIHFDRTGARAPERGDYLHGGGLPGAVRTKKAKDLAFIYGKGDVIQGGCSAEFFGKIFDFDHTGVTLIRE
jgi:hypothetical protein